MRNIILSLPLFLFCRPAFAETSNPRPPAERGAKEAEHDFLSSGPKVASYGGIVCIPAFGVSEADIPLLSSLPYGPSRCSCDQEDRGENEVFIRSYNLKMLELIKRRNAQKSN